MKRLLWIALATAVPGTGSAADTAADIDTWLAGPREGRQASAPHTALSREDAASLVDKVFARICTEARSDRAGELKRTEVAKAQGISQGIVRAAGMEMKLLERTFGEPPKTGCSLWISMHGGGSAPKKVNDGQWANQIMLYQPEEGIYVAPRAPTDAWNMWHDSHMDTLFDRMIENYVISRGVDPDRIYLLGYSAGGDGVYQLAPRMADRFAAASMMAGHPNDASPLGLRNLPFMTWCGAKDGAFKRNEVAREWGRQLDELSRQGGYLHETRLVDGKGHWMDRADAAAIPWMAQYKRDAWPKEVVWHQAGRLHHRFYWLAVEPDAAAKGQTIRAKVDGQSIVLTTEGIGKVGLRLHDALLDLDREISVSLNGKVAFRGKVERGAAAIFRSLHDRLDPRSAATAELWVGG